QLYSEQPLDLAVLTPLQDQQGKAIGEVACWASQQGLAVINAGSLPAALLAGDISLTGSRLFYTDAIHDGTDMEPAQRSEERRGGRGWSEGERGERERAD